MQYLVIAIIILVLLLVISILVIVFGFRSLAIENKNLDQKLKGEIIKRMKVEDLLRKYHFIESEAKTQEKTLNETKDSDLSNHANNFWNKLPNSTGNGT